MGNQLKLVALNFGKVAKAVNRYGKVVVGQAKAHKAELLTAISAGVIVDNIRVRLSRKKDKQVYKESALKFQTVSRKHEAEIRDLKVQADKSQEVELKQQQLERVIHELQKKVPSNG